MGIHVTKMVFPWNASQSWCNLSSQPDWAGQVNIVRHLQTFFGPCGSVLCSLVFGEHFLFLLLMINTMQNGNPSHEQLMVTGPPGQKKHNKIYFGMLMEEYLIELPHWPSLKEGNKAQGKAPASVDAEVSPSSSGLPTPALTDRLMSSTPVRAVVARKPSALALVTSLVVRSMVAGCCGKGSNNEHISLKFWLQHNHVMHASTGTWWCCELLLAPPLG